MIPTAYGPAHALAGGVLIGLGSLLALLASGKIPGISGLFSRIFRRRKGDTAWRVVFLLGLIAGAGIAFATVGTASIYRPERSLAVVGVAGVLVGFGARLGGGCTSGHGVCGIGMGSKNAIVATVIFMGAGMATVFVLARGGVSFLR